jgi:hypothetical protein
MAQDRYAADPDRLIVAGLMGAAQRHASWHELTTAQTAAAIAELRQIAGGRADLLAEVAGILEGAERGGARRAEGQGRRAAAHRRRR